MQSFVTPFATKYFRDRSQSPAVISPRAAEKAGLAVVADDIGNEEEATRWEREREWKGVIELEEEGYVPAKMRPFRKTRLPSLLPSSHSVFGIGFGIGRRFQS